MDTTNNSLVLFRSAIADLVRECSCDVCHHIDWNCMLWIDPFMPSPIRHFGCDSAIIVRKSRIMSERECVQVWVKARLFTSSKGDLEMMSEAIPIHMYPQIDRLLRMAEHILDRWDLLENKVSCMRWLCAELSDVPNVSIDEAYKLLVKYPSKNKEYITWMKSVEHDMPSVEECTQTFHELEWEWVQEIRSLNLVRER